MGETPVVRKHSIRKLYSRSPPELGVGADFVVDSIGVKHIAVDAPLAVAVGDVEDLVEVVAGGEAEFVVLEAAVFAGGAGEGLVDEDRADGRFGGEADAGAFDHKIVGD